MQELYFSEVRTSNDEIDNSSINENTSIHNRDSMQRVTSHKCVKSAVIHIHQNLLFFLEVATQMLSDYSNCYNFPVSGKISQMKSNIEAALSNIQTLCRINKGDLFFEELLSMLKRVEILLKMGGDSLSLLLQSLSAMEASISLAANPLTPPDSCSKRLSRTSLLNTK